MGSLMAGWDSPVSDPKSAKIQRNKSLTKEEIEAYWKSRKRTEEEHLKAISALLEDSKESLHTGSEPGLQRSISFPPANTQNALLNSDSKTDTDTLQMSKDWWTRSNWAFLNEPPVTAMEGPSYKYAAQYHVANIYKSNLESRPGIST